ncbi:MAG TPA: circularly permuted type 2 ATP-grasp protein [Leptospiraceae bacterium]|nr:circularly permuted type 2 ATP-grasp protein [Leptospiraceae bacterium]HNF13799.1 circularly permuted type 2 ATP-grasp protein [Leptospiraceae bacterium]HNF26206.1 circularly permuted type 2 ATP-grasp protein [Leptospiraceae bacterium]HNH07322.1 circularly permuted type 2 ATP-grasp protein [Leptospiraceae bacterium]HNI94484.1 circularly permuted type 2 ATP-grasp protein [Leptospiraceae bacterium]
MKNTVSLKNLKLEAKESFHEMYGHSGSKIRKEYDHILSHLKSENPESLRSLRKRIDFVLKEQGITFGESRKNEVIQREWYLDLIPHVISEDEFVFMESALKQRLSAYNSFLNDIYSERNILKEGIIPKEIILSDPNYIRDCTGIKLPKNIYIHMAAFDVVRSDDGKFLVLDDNMTIPSGISYAMTNRQVLRQQFPRIFQDAPVRQIWDTASAMYSILKECTPVYDNPLVVLLSPGIFNEAYSEHELLASNMGIPLVLPKDLIVKDNHVYMKTVHGLARVDVIYRRIQDYYLDPVCFYQDSVLGVPGLFSCVRNGNVTVANAIGSGIASSKALLPFVDEIIRFYTKKEPLMHTVPSFLLSNPKDREYIFNHIHQFVIKPIHGTGGSGILIGCESTVSQVEAFRKKTDADPLGYIAQKLIPLSKSRIFDQKGFAERFVETRFYGFQGSSFYLSSCALTRVSPEDNTMMVCNSMGGGSKDTWVLGKSISYSKNEKNFSYASGKRLLLSRVAENLFWLGRYVNRGFTTANVLLIAYTSEIDILLGQGDPSFNSLIKTLSKITRTPVKSFLKKGRGWQMEFFRGAITDAKNPSSMISSINYAMNNAREIQSYLSNDMWVSLKKLTEYLSMLPVREGGSINVEDLSQWLVGVIHYAQSFYGSALDTFSRQDILQFIQLGRYVEHCSNIITVLKNTIQFLVRIIGEKTQFPNIQPFIIVLLKILNSYEAYLWYHQSIFDPYLAYNMITTDRDFNNSLVSTLDKMKQILTSMRNEENVPEDETSPEYICDILISRAFSFNLRENLGKTSPEYKVRKFEHFLYTKNEVHPGYWANHLKAGIELLGGKIMDRYSNITSPTSFTAGI